MSILPVDKGRTSGARSHELMWLRHYLWPSKSSIMPVRHMLPSEDKVAEQCSLRGLLGLPSNTPAPLLSYFTSEMRYCYQKDERSENATGSGRDAARQALADVDRIGRAIYSLHGKCAVACSPKHMCLGELLSLISQQRHQ